MHPSLIMLAAVIVLLTPVLAYHRRFLSLEFWKDPAVQESWRYWRRILPLVLVLILILNPEIRTLAFFVDAVGLDFTLLLIALQLRHRVFLPAVSVVRPTYAGLCRLSRMPCFEPTVETARRMPVLLLHALPIGPIFFIGAVVVIVVRLCLGMPL